MATGVLPLLLGRAAKAADLLPDTAKEYRAAFRFGERTDTGDVTGKTVETDSRAVSRNSLDLALDGFRGQISQIPPMYSAVSVHGKRLYELARKGIEVEREARKIYIEKLVLEAYSPENREGVLRVACSKGTYIRTLIEDIAKSVGTCGVMTGLRRVRACGFQETEAHTLEELREYPAVRTSPAQALRFCNGGSLSMDRLYMPKITVRQGMRFRLYGPERVFLGLAQAAPESGELKFLKLFREQEDAL